VLLNQLGQMVAIGDQSLEQILVERQILLRRILTVHALFFLTTEQFDFVEPHNSFAVERQLGIRAKNYLGRSPAWFRAACLHKQTVTGFGAEARPDSKQVGLGILSAVDVHLNLDVCI